MACGRRVQESRRGRRRRLHGRLGDLAPFTRYRFIWPSKPLEIHSRAREAVLPMTGRPAWIAAGVATTSTISFVIAGLASLGSGLGVSGWPTPGTDEAATPGGAVELATARLAT